MLAASTLDNRHGMDRIALLDGVNDTLTIARHFAEHRVFAVQMRRGDMRDKKL
jgi:hypothetical protein